MLSTGPQSLSTRSAALQGLCMVLVLKVVDREAAMGDCETETTQVFEIFIWLGHYTAQASIMS